MAAITTSDSFRLHVEEAGSGTPIVFVHEFGGDHRSWEPQMRFFSRRYRCITFGARGYPPSDVPETVESYSQARAALDILDVISGLGIEKAHIVGLSMGGFAALHFGLDFPERALSVTAAGTGYGAEQQHEDYFRGVSETVAASFLEKTSKVFAPVYAEGASRVQFQNKDPRGWAEFRDRLAEHSELGAANTMRGVQMHRPSLYALEDRFRQMQPPVLVMTGDEDDHCLQPGLFLKRVIPACGLLVLPKSGHTLNLEEPAMFNAHLAEFFAMVEAGAWSPRDPRADPSQVMRTS